MIYECLVHRDTSIVISSEGSSSYDLSLDCVKPSYLDNLNEMSDLGAGIDPLMTMFLETLEDVVLILLYFHLEFKVEPNTFTRVMCGNKEPFSLT